MMIRMRTGIATKLMGAALRVFVFVPSVMGLPRAIEGVLGLGSWFKPMSRFWYLLLFHALFALLCILPYPSSFFQKAIKPLFLGVILLVCGFKYRDVFVSFHYASPELANYPAYVAEYEATKREPNGSGFYSRRKEGGKMLWIVRKADYSGQTIIVFGSFFLVPLILFLLRSYEVRRGINWRNFTSPPTPMSPVVPPSKSNSSV